MARGGTHYLGNCCCVGLHFSWDQLCDLGLWSSGTGCMKLGFTITAWEWTWNSFSAFIPAHKFYLFFPDSPPDPTRVGGGRMEQVVMWS